MLSSMEGKPTPQRRTVTESSGARRTGRQSRDLARRPITAVKFYEGFVGRADGAHLLKRLAEL